MRIRVENKKWMKLLVFGKTAVEKPETGFRVWSLLGLWADFKNSKPMVSL
ncbi:uncharacterized protein G2W53_032228 [Senna tora]|uniref:Uncharacterized protein n=1 Tax=Senna tora TaxID=362788 RepID=A0A834W6L3_9FABA|nr:uncharacterized protein G2W53_032228 [Senna tora]